MSFWIWEICKTTNVWTCHVNTFMCVCIYRSNVRIGFLTNHSHTQKMLGLVSSVNSCICVIFQSSCGVKPYLDTHFCAGLSIVFILVLDCCFYFSTKGMIFSRKELFFLQKQCLLLIYWKNNTVGWSGKLLSDVMYHRCIWKYLRGVILCCKHTNILSIYAFLFRCFSYYKKWMCRVKINLYLFLCIYMCVYVSVCKYQMQAHRASSIHC